MAVIDDLPGVEVNVSVNGNPLKEYEDPDEEVPENTVMRYIEAASGKEFTIDVKMNQGCHLKGDSLSFDVYADGKWADGRVLDANHAKIGFTSRIRGFNDFRNITTFRFAELETVSDGFQLKREGPDLRDLGTLSVKLFHSKRTGTAKPTHEEGPSELGFVSEKALKGRALSHSVGSGTVIAERATKLVKVDRIGEKFVIEFRYRSLESLRSQLIIPRTPTPPPLEERDTDSMSLEELREFHRRAKEAKESEEAKRKIKREQADENPRPRKTSRPGAGDTQLELDDDGSFRESSTATLDREEQEVIELD